MPRFFVPDENFYNGHVKITGDDARHIARALRMACGDEVTVCDMRHHLNGRVTDEHTIVCAGQRSLCVTVLHQAVQHGLISSIIQAVALIGQIYVSVCHKSFFLLLVGVIGIGVLSGLFAFGGRLLVAGRGRGRLTTAEEQREGQRQAQQGDPELAMITKHHLCISFCFFG